MKYGSRSGRNMDAAPGASELFPTRNTMEAIGFAATAMLFRVALFEQIAQAGVIIRKLFVKVFDRIFHFHGDDFTKVGWTSAVQVKFYIQLLVENAQSRKQIRACPSPLKKS
jgi:hypothetical protein